jgi:hypothetical protein
MTRHKLLMIIGLFSILGFALAPSPSAAQVKKEICDNAIDDDGDKAIDCEDSDCSADPFCKEPPPKDGFCHNIGGPEATGGGADCDPETDACTVTEEGTGRTFTVYPEEFFGIIIGTSSPKAILAHLAHGDGPTVEIIDPPLHLASQGDNHKASNVECIGTRLLEQPDEPGN